MIRFVTILMAAVIGLVATPELQAQAQILIVDNERVEAEAAAYKDFRLQTNDIRESIVQLRQAVSQGGTLEQRAADIEKQKAISGNAKYEEDMQQLQREAQQISQQLRLYELAFDQVREEAFRQVERARQPVIRQIIKSRGAQIIIPKRLVLGNAAGIDVTTEFIELLDEELSQVTLETLARLKQGAQATQQSQQGESAGEGIEEID